MGRGNHIGKNPPRSSVACARARWTVAHQRTLHVPRAFSCVLSPPSFFPNNACARARVPGDTR